MKIAFVNDMIYPFNIGGTELKIYEHAKRLVKKSHEVHLFGVKFWKGKNTIKSKEGIILHGICRYKKLYSFSGKRTILEPLIFATKIYPALKKHKFDIIDCAAFVYLHLYPTIVYAKETKTPLVITWNQFWGDYWYEYLNPPVSTIGKILEKLSTKITKHHIAVSQTTKKDLTNQGVKKENIFVSYGGIDLKTINSIPKQKKEYDLIYVGRLNHQKNVQLLIHTTAILKKEFPKIKVCIIGDGPNRQKLENLTKELNLQDNIQFKGFLKDKKEIYKALKSSKIFILPSLLEGFGIVVIEANACSLPTIVIKNKWNASRELIQEGKNGFISENNSKILAKKITQMLTNKKILNQMSKQSKDTAQKFDWGILTDELEKHYKEIIRDAKTSNFNKNDVLLKRVP